MDGLTLELALKDDDWEFIRQLRNDVKNLDGFIDIKYIDKEQQKLYSLKHACEYWICWKNSERVGFIGCVDKDIRVCVKHEYKKQGIGKFMILEMLEVFKHRKDQAKIKIDNEASKKLFESCGFKLKYYVYEP